MDARFRQAVLTAARRQAEGQPVSLYDRGFWREFGLSDLASRRDVVARADALNYAWGQEQGGDYTGTIGDLFAGTAYPAGHGDTGPADTSTANIYARVSFEDAQGNIVYRSVADTFRWDDDLSSIFAAIDDAIADFEGFYGLSGGMLEMGSLIIY